MSRITRSNCVKAKVWTGRMTSEIEGTIAGTAIELFQMAPPAARATALQRMQELHTKLSESEAARALEAVTAE